jgi:hypothetical protein
MDNYWMGANGMRTAILAAGMTPHLYLQIDDGWYQDFTTSSPAEYAKAVAAIFIHDHNKYGVTPDVVDIMNEPDNTGWWTSAKLGAMAAATKTRLNALGFNSEIWCCSTLSYNNAVPWYNGAKAAAGAGVITGITSHPYAGSIAGEQAVAAAAAADGIPHIMTEYVNLGITNAYEYIKNARASGIMKMADAYYAAGGLASALDYLDIISKAPYAAQYVAGNETQPDAASPAWYFPQLWGYVPEGSMREQVTATNADALAYLRPDGQQVAVVTTRATGSQTFQVAGLPAGTYACTYTINNSNLLKRCGANQTIGSGGTLNYTISNIPSPVVGPVTAAITFLWHRPNRSSTTGLDRRRRGERSQLRQESGGSAGLAGVGFWC